MDINDLLNQASRKLAVKRASRQPDDAATAKAPAPSAAKTARRGLPLVRRASDDRVSYTIGGRPVNVGDPIEVYTNAANGWVRGRFEWTEQPDDAPRLAIHCWDPDGKPDADGLPPWVGELVMSLPSKVSVRWPRD